MHQAAYENVKVETKANVYYDGKVLSHAFFMQNGDRKTLGIMFPGEYEFGTGDAEIMEVIAGALTVMLPGKTTWETYGADQSFDIPANSKFRCKCTEISEYVCSYIKA